MKCKLCLQEKKLCQSHIIPEFLFKPTYDEKHRANQLIIEPYGKLFIQKGFREELLCETCEREFCKLEKYFSQEWKEKIPEVIEEKVFFIENLDYKKFKLFHLSILWRASVSKRKEFEFVSLGHHEEKIRKMLLDKDAGSENRYCFFAKVLVFKNQVVQDLILQPIMSRLEAQRAFVFIFGGCVWHYLISSHPTPKKYMDICFSKKGSIPLAKEEMNNSNYIRDFMRQYHFAT